MDVAGDPRALVQRRELGPLLLGDDPLLEQQPRLPLGHPELTPAQRDRDHDRQAADRADELDELGRDQASDTEGREAHGRRRGSDHDGATRLAEQQADAGQRRHEAEHLGRRGDQRAAGDRDEQQNDTDAIGTARERPRCGRGGAQGDANEHHRGEPGGGSGQREDRDPGRLVVGGPFPPDERHDSPAQRGTRTPG